MTTAGLLCAVLGFLRYWTLMKVALSFPSAPSASLNLEIWISLGSGVFGALVLLVALIVYATREKKA